MNSSELPYIPNFRLVALPDKKFAIDLYYETGARHPVEPEISKSGNDRNSRSHLYELWLEEQQHKRESQ